MSIQWTLIAGYLYFEIGVVSIMMLPLFSPRKWHQLFKSRLFTMVRQHAGVYFYVLLGVLCLFLMDAVREMKKYSHGGESSHVPLANELKGNVKLFRAQRNFYITGFSIFLTFVIRRLITMLIILDQLNIKAEKIIKEAVSTVDLAKNTVLANIINREEIEYMRENKLQLEETKLLLHKEKNKVKRLEDAVKHWKQQFEQVTSEKDGTGDNELVTN